MKRYLSIFLALIITASTIVIMPAITVNAQNAIVNPSGTVVINRAYNNMSGINPGTELTSLLSSLSASTGTIRFLDASNQVVTTGMVSTGMKVQLIDNLETILDNLTLIVYGDVNGDGSIENNDLASMKAHILKSTELTGSNLSAADLSANGSVSITDLLGLKKALLGLTTVSQNPLGLTVETVTDSTTLNDLTNTGTIFTENFTKNELVADPGFSQTHRSIVSGAESISGNSLKCDFTLGIESASTFFFNTIGKISANGKYRVTLSYKYLTDIAPTGFYVGMNSSADTANNVIIDFAGKQKNTVYSFTNDYTLGNHNDYYLLWFNLSNNDGSKLVIDSVKIERMQNLAANLLSFNTPYVENFTTGYRVLDASAQGTIISGANAIDGESLLITHPASASWFYFFQTNGLMSPNSTYKINFKYKIQSLTTTVPAFTAGLTLSGGANTTSAITLSGKTIGQVYDTGDIIIRTANSANYFPSFNLGAKGISLVIDDYTITRIDAPHLADLLVVNKPFIENFTIGQSILMSDSKGTVISGANAIDGNSLSISSPPGGMFYFFQTLGYMAPNASYKISFKFKVLNAPENGALGLPGLYAGLTLSGGGNDVQQIDLMNKTDGNVYQTPDLTFNTGASANYFPSFWINGEQAFNIVIDDYTLIRIS